MELYVSRTPGARIEQKETSLVWHYRQTDPELGNLRRRELRHALEPLVANERLVLLEGSRILEARIAGVDKGQVAAGLCAGESPDFVLAAGDDRTDEDMFAALPPDAWTICVRRRGSRARYRANSPYELRIILAAIRGDTMFQLEDYRDFVGDEIIAELHRKARRLLGRRVLHINSTYQGGGVAELLASIVPLFNDAGVDTDWRVLAGDFDFFSVTKKFHNALQGGHIDLTKRKRDLYESMTTVRKHDPPLRDVRTVGS